MASKPLPKYLQIYEYFINQIISENYHENQKLPSETEIMEQFSVSRIVAINALKKLSNEGYIHSVARKGSFVSSKSNSIAKAFSNAALEQKRVVLIVPEVQNQFSASFVREIDEQLYANNAYCSIHYSNNSLQRESNLIDYAKKTMADGIILFPCDQDTYTPPLLSAVKKNLPILLIDRDMPGLGLSSVSTDNVEAMKMITSHLINLNHKKIAVFSNTAMKCFSITDRINGFLLEMNANNMFVDPSHIITPNDKDILKEKLNHIIENKLVTSFICLNPYDFETVIQTIQNHGFSCPDDFSVAHFDNIAPDSFIFSQTTHIRQNTVALASKTISILMDSIKEQKNLNQKINIPSNFINGFTTKRL